MSKTKIAVNVRILSVNSVERDLRHVYPRVLQTAMRQWEDAPPEKNQYIFK